MIATIASVESFCNLLARSKLLKPREIRAAFRQRPQTGSRAGTAVVSRFAQELVAQHYLTPYQAQQLALGQSGPFFLNHYRLLDLIGKGRMAGIFKAAHSLGHIVAIKLMPQSKSKDAQLVARFKREARMAVRLKHPQIVRTFHMGSAGGRHYLVMEHLEGETLADVLQRRGKLPFQEAVRLLHQALQALQHIHEQGMVHRDLTPGNFFLAPPRPPGSADTTLYATVKILDIGLGRVLFDENVTTDMEQGLLTTEGMLLGTPEYMSPEQARDAHNVDIRTDLYSLGCVLYHLLAGHPPFTDKQALKQIVRHASEKPRPIRELAPTVPSGLQAVLDTLLAKQPGSRYATPAHAARALQPFLPQQAELGPAVSALAQSYLKWVECQPVEEVTAAPLATGRWYYRRGGQTCGPVTSAQLSQLVSTGGLTPEDRLWMEGDDPTLALPARAAIDFSAVKQPASKPSASASQAPRTSAAFIASAGYDPETGQVFDAVKFKQWQKAEQAKKAATAVTQPSVQEVFLNARVHLDRWVDFERNRRPILTGDMDYIRQHPDIQRFLSHHVRYGQEMVHKLWHYLQYTVENRRKYYVALS